MAKKKQKEDDGQIQEESALSSIINSPFCTTGTELTQVKRDIISISPCLDIITGGIPLGSCVLLTGDPKSGKSLTSLTIARNAQKIGCPVFYLNVEARLKPRDLEGISGLDLDNFNIIGSYYKNKKTSILSAEEYLGEAEKIIHTIPRSVIIVDSVSHLITKNELAKDLGEKDYAPGPVLMAQFLKRIYNVLSVNEVVLISILHYTTNMDPNSRKKKHKSGGRKIAHAADVDLEAKYFKIIKNKTGYPIGQEVIWQTLSTAFLPPGQEITSTIRYGYGIDDIAEWIKLGQDLALIDLKGAWYSLAFTDDDQQVQGKENLRQILFENPKMLKLLQDKVKEMISPQ